MTHERADKEVSGRAYVIALLVLLALTGLSYLAWVIDLGPAATVVAIGIASIKAFIVGYVFMHLAEAIFATRLVGLVTVLFIAILCLGIWLDVGFR
jgi:cytochrome c oxidase subunit IV